MSRSIGNIGLMTSESELAPQFEHQNSLRCFLRNFYLVAQIRDFWLKFGIRSKGWRQ
jgi:hypothetical protein